MLCLIHNFFEYMYFVVQMYLAFSGAQFSCEKEQKGKKINKNLENKDTDNQIVYLAKRNESNLT